MHRAPGPGSLLSRLLIPMIDSDACPLPSQRAKSSAAAPQNFALHKGNFALHKRNFALHKSNFALHKSNFTLHKINFALHKRMPPTRSEARLK